MKESMPARRLNGSTSRLLVGGLLSALLLLTACHRNSPYQQQGIASLQGTWTEDTAALHVVPARSVVTRYNMRFTCDSVYMVLNTHAGQDYFATPCYAGGNYTEYVKGTYIIHRDSLVVTAVFTHPNYKMKVAGCYRSGNIRFWYQIKEQTDSTLKLRNTDEHGPMFMKKIKACKCVPQRIGD